MDVDLSTTASPVLENRATVTLIDPLLRSEVQDFLYHEAALLDSLDLEAWLMLFTSDGRYALPMGGDRQRSPHWVSLLDDDHAHLEERVTRILSGKSFSQTPPSRTLHVIGNVTVSARDDSMLAVNSNQIISELRRGIQRVFSGHCLHLLRREGTYFRIVSKTMTLLNRDEPMGDLTFLL